MLNNNFNELVHKYKRYRNKKRKKIALILLALVLFIAAIFYFFNHSSLMQTPEEDSKTSQNVAIAPATNTTKEPLATATSLPPIKETKEPETKSIAKPTPLAKTTTSSSHKKRQEQTFELKVSSSKNLYQLLVQHKNEKSYKSAIAIAKFYYHNKNYKKAVKWAIEASKKDPKKAEAWIIYAKSKVALGKPDVAKKALAIYLKHNFSQEAQDLLNSL